MRITVCQLNDDPLLFTRDWAALCQHAVDTNSELVLLPEMPFYPWLASHPDFNLQAWQLAVQAHDSWLERLAELAPAWVLGTRPVERNNQRLNEAFLWHAKTGYTPVHAKHYLPQEEGFWEASWFQRGNADFQVADCADFKVGFTVCTELWFLEKARHYGKQGVHMLANPRATLRSSLEKWLVGGRAAAVVSGAYVLSSNKVSPSHSSLQFGGQAWVVDPDGQVLGLTSPDSPFLTVEIDLQAAQSAKQTYPRYVEE